MRAPAFFRQAGWASSLAPHKGPSGEIETLTTFPRWSGSFLCEGTRAAPQRYMGQAGWVLFRKPELIRRRDPGVIRPPGSYFFLGPEFSPVRPRSRDRSGCRVRLYGRVAQNFSICHIRDAGELTSFRQRDPRISQARIIFALVGIVRFLCQRCAPCGRFPCGLTFGSHLVCPIAVCP